MLLPALWFIIIALMWSSVAFGASAPPTATDFIVGGVGTGVVTGAFLLYHNLVIKPDRAAVDRRVDNIDSAIVQCNAHIESASGEIFRIIREGESDRSGFERRITETVGKVDGKLDVVLRLLNGKDGK